MNKRPLLILGAGTVLISFILVCFFPHLIYPPSGTVPGGKVSFTCSINRIEEKDNRVMLFVRHGRFRLLLTADKEHGEVSRLKTGNVITANCTYTEWKRARNKGNFDEQDHYRSLGIYQKYKLNSFIVTDRTYSVFKEILRSFRKRLSLSIINCADEETAGVLNALVTGSRGELDDESDDLFRISGIAHVLAISGLHVSFIGMGIFRILRKKIKFPAAAFCSLIMVYGYVLMSSASASSVRAFIMLAVSLTAKWIGRKYDMISSMSLALILLLFSNPFYVTNPGFILSFTAVTAVAILSGTVSDFTSGSKISGDSETGHKILFHAARALAMSISISAATLPVISSMYYEFPLFGPLANLVMLALMPYILGGTLAGAVAGIFSTVLGKIILGAPVFLTRAVNAICRIFAAMPLNSVTTGHRSVINVIIYYLILVLAWILLKTFLFRNDKFKKRNDPIGTGSVLKRTAIVIMSYFLLILVISVKIHDNALHVTFLDVDQGECILISDKTGTVYLIDAGSSTVNDVYEHRIKSALKYHGISRIDYLFVTHPDTDHVSAVLECFKESYGNLRVQNLLIPEFNDNEIYNELISLAEKNCVKVSQLSKGLSVSSKTLSIECIHPFNGVTYPGTNEGSAVMILKYGSFSALFTGDISSEQEMIILEDRGGDLDCDLLDVAHHGSRYSSCDEFLKAVSPALACISAGVSNSYGHPHEETMERLHNAGARTYITSECGEIDITVKSSGSVGIQCMSDEWQGSVTRKFLEIWH